MLSNLYQCIHVKKSLSKRLVSGFWLSFFNGANRWVRVLYKKLWQALNPEYQEEVRAADVVKIWNLPEEPELRCVFKYQSWPA